MKVLIVEDEKKTAAFLKQGLEENGFEVDVADNGHDGLALASKAAYDLIILDVMLPRLDGWHVIEALRERNFQNPVLFLTARDAVEDRVKGLKLGADDYLVKPFAFSELLARIQVLLRRRAVELPEVLRIDDLQIDIVRQRVTRGGQLIDLSAKEFQVLLLLVRHAGSVLSRELLSRDIWGMDFDPETNIVDVAIRRLRMKVDEPFSRNLIHTIRGVGYQVKVSE